MGDTIKKARELRKNMTDAERVLWYHLRNKQMRSCKFRRQHPIGDYIVDFICIERKLIIEVDGGQHAEQEHYDIQRTAFLEGSGYSVLRFWNNDVLRETGAVLESISDALTGPPP